MKTHYDGFMDPEEEVRPICKTQGYELDASDNWDWVTCKKCLKLKDRAIEERNEIEKDIVKQMGDFVDFINSNKLVKEEN